MKFIPTIGLEIHVQLNTKSKLFCNCDNDSWQAEPNINTCPICTGHPGHLPLVNKKAIEKAAKLGLALGCEISPTSVFDRKNYFYPDLPLGYQITQLHHPIAKNGAIEIQPEGSSEPIKVRINRAHIEADAGKLTHQNGKSFADWNRACTPLVEIVTEPDLHSASEAKALFENIRAISRAVDASFGDMEKGHLRCDANVSLAPEGSSELGTRSETKNLNSFKAVEAAIQFEIERQTELLEKGEKVIQETRGWDDVKKITTSQRSKEESHDYRYFPEPDLPPLTHSPEWVQKLKSSLPELPAQKRQRFSALGLQPHDSRTLSLDETLSSFFDQINAKVKDPKATSRWLLSELQGRLTNGQTLKDTSLTPAHFIELISLIQDQTISGKIAKEVFDHMLETGHLPQKIIAEKNLKQVSDSGELEEITEQILKENPDAVSKIKNGDDRPFKFLIGQVMSKTQGQANPALVNDILKQKLS